MTANDPKAGKPAGWQARFEAIKGSKRLRTAIVALGLSNLAFYWMAGELISPRHLTVYHWSGPTLALFAPIWLDLVGFCIVAALLLRLAEFGPRWRRAVWVGILVGLPAMVAVSFTLGIGASDIVLGMGNERHIRFLFLWLYGLSPLAWLALLVAWRPSFDRYFDRAVRFVEVVLTFCGIAGVMLLAQMAWFTWMAAGLNAPRPLHTQSAAQPVKPRILWLVMDELSYQQVYEQRFPGLELPSFDRLADGAAVFTRVTPVGLYTDHILPSLISGRPVEDIRSTGAGMLRTRETASSAWQPYNQHDTVFKDALAKGYSTGVAGWWNPYCRILPEVLDHCFWTAWYLEHKELAPDSSLGSKLKGTVERAMVELGLILPNRVGGRLEDFGPDDRLHVAETYMEISQQGDKLLMDPSTDFVMIHISIPHPVGIYNRATGRLSAEPTSYVDNLALADLYLAHLRSELEARGEWDSTTLVLMGDHGWRTQIWKSVGWGKTDEAASNGGKFDTRPGYIVKLPNQHQGARIKEPFHALETRALLDALMDGQIGTEAELEAWVRAHP